MIVVGLGNKARHGKSTFAETLAATDKRVKLYALANELKTYCAEHHDELYEKYPHVGKDTKDDPIYGYVKMLQFYGTDVARKENQNVWVDALQKRIEAEKPEIAVVTDVRFPNEAEWVRKNENGVLVRVVRLLADGTFYVDPQRDANHPSETALDSFEDWDFIVACFDGEVEALKESARIILEEILKVLEPSAATQVVTLQTD